MASDLPARLASLLEQSRDPIFLMNQRRRFLYVNPAWEQLTEVPHAEARRLACSRREAALGISAEDAARSLCCPPPKVFAGKSARVRRLRPEAPPGKRWWNIDFLPLCDSDGTVFILGRIELVPEDTSAPQHVEDTPPAHRKKQNDAQAPARLERLAQLRERAYARYQLDCLQSSHPAMRRAVEQARLASQNRFPVFLHGECGTGKEWLARAIHAASPMREQVFIALDCEHLPLASVSEVFYGEHVLDGHIPVGTIYLREPAFLPRDFQVRLLEFVQETTLPSPRAEKLPRIIAGTVTISVSDASDKRLLLDDLYNTLSIQSINLIPLRQRPTDIPHQIESFLTRLQQDDSRTTTLSAAAIDCLRTYAWPANLRELFSVLSSARTHATRTLSREPVASAVSPDAVQRILIDVPDLPTVVRVTAAGGRPTPTEEVPPLPLEKLLEEAERRLILVALSRAGGNKTRAAEMLSIFRPRLLRRMEALGIAEPSAITEDPP